MKRFVVPPSWPTPPRRSWSPPENWQPDPAWPPAPAGWKFWVNGRGRPVTGPIGRFGGPSKRAVGVGVTAALVFLSANLWGLNAMGLFDGDKPSPRAAPLTEQTPDPFASLTPVPSTSPQTSGSPTTRPTSEPTSQPTSRPTKTRPTRQPNRSQQRRPVRRTTPVPTRPPAPPSVAPTSRPTTAPTTSQPPTQEEILAEYCRQRGLDPKWCDPSNWPSPPERHRRR